MVTVWVQTIYNAIIIPSSQSLILALLCQPCPALWFVCKYGPLFDSYLA